MRSEQMEKARSFENFTHLILKKIAKDNSQSITVSDTVERYNNALFEYEAIAPNGFERLGGKVRILVIFANSLSLLINDVEEYLREHIREQVLVVTNLSFNQKDIKKPSDELTIWDKEKIDDLSKQYFIDAYTYFDTEINKVTSEEFEHNNELNKSILIESIKEYHRKHTLVLGAGVSLSYGLPDWDDLLSEFIEEITSKTIAINSDYIFDKIGNTELIRGQFVVDNLSKYNNIGQREKYFVSRLRNEFYRKDFSTIEDTTLNSICRLIERNCGKFDVITYNYDDLLEQNLKAQTDLKFDTVYFDKTIKADKLPIFHVHGYLPRTGKVTDDVVESVIFSEFRYHKLYNDPYSWQNTCQLSRFREHSCLFIGMSLRDPDVRRLLEKSAERQTNDFHFTILYKGEKGNLEDYLVISKHYQKLGVIPIWVNSIEDIPVLLDSM